MKNLIFVLVVLVPVLPSLAADRRPQPVLPGESKPIPSQMIVPAPVSAKVPVNSSPIQQVIRAQEVVVPTPTYTRDIAVPGISAGCSSCANSRTITTPIQSTGHGWFGANLREAYLQHICAPDGCLKPIGCGNFWTTKKFIFGGCRQFFGTAESAEGHHKQSFVR